MGTNFYLFTYRTGRDNHMDPQFHVGKRSAGGPYCWDCRLTLRLGGESRIHHIDTVQLPGESLAEYLARKRETEWWLRCPGCGQAPVDEGLSASAAGRELGFNTSPPAPKTGVRSCSTFNWAMEPESLRGQRGVVDEYGRRLTIAEFRAMLAECPVQYTRSIGQWFN